jgi:transcriptional regulator with XRE-family HTH domain
MTDFPDALKVWRRTRRFSQLELAAEANVSARHIAFLETGRARPSPAMIGRLGEALQIPLAARNQMLTLAGFATRYPARQWDASEMAPIRAALEHTLEQHAPYPGIAIDRMWTVVRLNRPAKFLFGQLGMVEGSSLLDLMASDELPPLIENWPDVAHHAAQRLRTESAAQGGVTNLDRLAEKLAAVPGGSGKPIGPVTPTIYRTGTMRLSLFAIIAQFGTPEDLALDDLKIELFFPADPETEQTLRAMQA